MTNEPIKTADYYASAKNKYVRIGMIANGERTYIKQIKVSGKIEARRIAAQENAKCWNF